MEGIKQNDMTVYSAEKKRLTVMAGLFLLVILSALIPLGAALAGADDPPRAIRLMAEPDDKEVLIRSLPLKKGEVVFTLPPGDSCEIIGQEGDYYLVRKGEQSGYTARRLLKTRGEDAEPAISEKLCPELYLADSIPDRHALYLELQGTLTSDEPVETLFLYVWDERLLRLEKTVIKPLETPSTTVSMDLFARALHFNKLSGGRKTVYLEGLCGGEMKLFFRSPAYICRENEEIPHVTEKCKGLPGTVTDTKLTTAWKASKKKASLAFTIPEEAEAVLMTLEWKELPEPYTVTLEGAQGEILSEMRRDGGFYMDSVSLSGDVRAVRITPDSMDSALSSVRVYSEPYPRHVIQQWEKIPEKIDILFIATHQDDELLWFGGGIPEYAAREDVNVAVLYLCTCSRLRCREALDGLWTAGLRNHPIFLGLRDVYTFNEAEARAKWKAQDPESMLVEVFRKYRPDVVVCQDIDGEYGHGQHKVGTSYVISAMERAAEQGGEGEPWDIKKLYIHLYKENTIQMDWTRQLDDSGVITPLFLAIEGYDKHKSQHAYFSMRRDGSHYDNTLFGLYRTTVGLDVNKDDFLENTR